MSELHVGFIGLGNIGRPMAVNLAKSDFPTTVFDIDPEACKALAEAGAEVAANPAELAKGAGFIGVCVRNDADTFDVVDGENGLLRTAGEGTLIAIHSTVRPATIETLAAKGAAQGVTIFDAPMTGGAHGAAAGQLTYMVGCDEATFERAQPFLDVTAKSVLHAGPITHGIKLKLCNNLVTYVQYVALHEAQKLARASGLSLDVLGEVMTQNGLMNVGAGLFYGMKKGMDLPSLRNATENFRAIAVKDLSAALELADALEIALPGTGMTREQIKQVFGADA